MYHYEKTPTPMLQNTLLSYIRVQTPNKLTSQLTNILFTVAVLFNPKLDNQFVNPDLPDNVDLNLSR